MGINLDTQEKGLKMYIIDYVYNIWKVLSKLKWRCYFHKEKSYVLCCFISITLSIFIFYFVNTAHDSQLPRAYVTLQSQILGILWCWQKWGREGNGNDKVLGSTWVSVIPFQIMSWFKLVIFYWGNTKGGLFQII